MPHRDHRVIVVTPAGRQQYLRLLIPQVLAYASAGVVDEYHLWVNTRVKEDVAFMEAAAAGEHGSVLRVRYLPSGMEPLGNKTIGYFFKECVMPNTVYVRLDDDVIFLDDLEAFKGFLDFRIMNPHYFLVYANILNNALVSYLHQDLGNLGMSHGRVGYSCMDSVGWASGPFAAYLHDRVLRV
jgi:hypothetical protein